MSRLTRHEQADGDTQKSQRPFLQQVIAIPFEICYSRTSNFIHSLFSIPPLFHKLIVFTSLTMILVALLVVIIVPIVIATPPPPKKAAHLPDVDTFNKQNGSQWKIQYTGDIKFTGALGKLGLGGDKCRSSFLGGRHIWNCGDMMCGTWDKCGFSMGAAFYGTKSVSVINASAHSNVGDFTFASPWHGDPKPESPQSQYGMDTSNVVPINDTTGVAYIWEITRGAPDTPYANKGAGVVAVTLGATQPIATRVGPLLTGPDSVGLGIFAIIRDDRYIYNYKQI
jgi:hypothetical protein